MCIRDRYIIDQILPYISIIGANIDDYMPSVITLLIYVDLNTFGDLTINLEYRDEEGHVLFDGKYIDNYETCLLYTSVVQPDHIFSML